MEKRIEQVNQIVRITGTLIAIGGIALLGCNLLLHYEINVALPMLFLLAGVAVYGFAMVILKQWAWGWVLFFPGSLLLALGIIFLFNVLTNDWNAWAYAWLLLVVGEGQALALAAWFGNWERKYSLAGAGLVVAGLILYAGFGMIAGGSVIAVTAPLLLALAGLGLRRVKIEQFLPERWQSARKAPAGETTPAVEPPTAVIEPLVEPLSTRELEVLRLIGAGLTNQEIAERLTLAPSTVKTHINNMYGKLGVQTRVQAIKRAQELGLLGAFDGK